MNKTFANILNRFLSVWVEDLNSEQLNLSIFSGKILLKDLKLKPDFLDILGLPFYLASGTVSSIQVKIPWKALYSSPLKVKVSDVVVLLKPVQVKDWSFEKEKEAVMTRRKYFLENFELMNPDEFEISSDGTGSGVFLGKLIGNLTVCLENVYFRYEDSFFTSEPFVIGGFVGKVKMVNCDGKWQKSCETEELGYKIALVQRASVFVDYSDGIVICQDWYDGDLQSSLSQLLNDEKQNLIHHNYLLSPLSVQLKLTLNKSQSPSFPLLSMQIEGESCSLNLNSTSIEFILAIKKLINEHLLFKKSVEDSLPDRNFTNDEITKYRQVYMNYRTEIRTEGLSLSEQKRLKMKVEDYEIGIFIDEIKIQRKAVLDELKIQKVQQEKLSEIERIKRPNKNKDLVKGLYKFVVRSSEDNEGDLEQDEKIKNAEMELARIEFRDSSMVRQVTRARTNKLEFLKDSVQQKITLLFTRMSISLSDDSKDYLITEAKSIKLEVSLRLASHNLSLSLSDLSLQSPISKWSQILQVKHISLSFDNLDKIFIKLHINNLSSFLDFGLLSSVSLLLQKLLAGNQETEESLDSVSDSSLKSDEEDKGKWFWLKDLLENGVTKSYIVDLQLNDWNFSLPFDYRDCSTDVCRVGFRGLRVRSEDVLKGLMHFDVYEGDLNEFCVRVVRGAPEDYAGVRVKSVLVLDLHGRAQVAKTRQFYRTGFRVRACGRNGFVDVDQKDLKFFDEMIRNNSLAEDMIESEEEFSFQSQGGAGFGEFVRKLDDIIQTKIFISFEELRLNLGLSDLDLKIVLYGLETRIKLNKHKKLLLLNTFQRLELNEQSQINNLVSLLPNAGKEPAVKFSLSIDPIIKLIDICINVSSIQLNVSEDFIKKVLIIKNSQKKNTERVFTMQKSVQNTENHEYHLNFFICFHSCKFEIKTNQYQSWSTLTLSFSSSLTYTISKTLSSIKTSTISSSAPDESFQKDLSLQISHIHLTLSNKFLSKSLTSQFRLITNYESSNPSQFNNLSIKLEHLSIFLGFRDINFIQSLLSLFTSTNSSKSLQQEPNNELESTIYIQSLILHLDDDTVKVPVPLLLIEVKDLMTVSNASSVISTGSVKIDTFDNLLKIWQPFVEKWNFWNKIENQGDVREIFLESSQGLEVNLSPCIAFTLGTVYKKGFQDVKDWEEMYQKGEVLRNELDYEIFNRLGVLVSVWISGDSFERFEIEPEGKLKLTYSEVDKKHKKSSQIPNPESTPHSISLSLYNSSSVSSLSIQTTKSESFSHLSPYNCQTLIKSIEITSTSRTISLLSSNLIINRTSIPISLQYLEKSSTISDFFFIPINLSPSSIQIKGEEDSIKLTESNYIQIEKGKFISIYTENVIYSDLNLKGFIIEAPFKFTNNLVFDIILYIEDREEFLIPSKETRKFYGIGISACKLALQILNKETVLYTETFTLENEENYFKIINEFAWEVKVTCKNSQVLMTEVTFTCDYLVINSTLLDVKVGKIICPKMTVGFWKDPQKSTTRVQVIGNEETGKSEKININALGLSKCVTLIPADKKFKTKMICLVMNEVNSIKCLKVLPRYVIKNMLMIPIYVRQFSPKVLHSYQKLNPNEVLHFNFDDVNENSIIQISGNLVDWSSGFRINAVDDFQIKFKHEFFGDRSFDKSFSDNSFRLSLLRQVDEDWYMPSVMNNFSYCVRITVSSAYQACANICIRNPNFPDFQIVNNTKLDIKIRQYQTKSEYSTLSKGQSSPWVFENYLKRKKKVQIKIGSLKEVFSINEELETKKGVGPLLIKRYGCGNTRFFEIFEEGCDSPNLLSMTENQDNKKTTKYQINLSSFSCSLFSEQVLEQVSISMNELNLKYKLITETIENHKVSLSKTNLIIGNMQIDNMRNDLKCYPVLLKRENNDPDTPFFQLKYKREFSSINPKVPIDVFHYFETQVQPSYIYVNHEILLDLLNLNRSLMNSFYQSRTVLNDDIEPDSFLEPSESYKSYFKFIRIHTLTTKLTFRKSKDSEILSGSPDFLRVLSNKFIDFALITESPLSLKEVIIENSFQDRYSLFWSIIKNYSIQSIFQFYRILGATEILGNPIGLVESLGTGVYEFFSEPAKGLLLGPKDFIQGVTKGTKSLVGNIVAGGFGSVASIAGSLYKIVSEEHSGKNPILNDLGIYDLKYGIQGVAFKPYKGFKNHGVVGMVSGIFKGLWGVSVAPVAAILHISHTVANRLAVEANELRTKDKGLRQKLPKKVNFIKKIENDSGWDFKKNQVENLISSLGKLKIIQNFGFEIVAISENKVFVIVGDNIVKEIKLDQVIKPEIHLIGKKFFLVLILNKNQVIISSSNPSPAYRIYQALNHPEIYRHY